MADTVNSRIIPTPKRVIAHLTCLSDGTGEAAVKKVDRDTLTAIIDGAQVVPTKLKIKSMRWAIQGFSSISVLWDHTTDDVAMILSGNGYEEFPDESLLTDPNTSNDAVTGSIGDLLLTSRGAAANASYDITLVLVIA